MQVRGSRTTSEVVVQNRGSQTKAQLPYYLAFSFLPRLFFATSLFLSYLAVNVAEAGPGTVAVPFLRVGAGARPSAMGGAFAAVADDANASVWNPAGLSQLSQAELGFMRLMYYEGSAEDVLVASIPMGSKFGLGVHVISMNYGKFDYMVEDASGSFDATASTVAGTYKASALAAALGAGFELFPGVSIGANGKFITQSLEKTSGTGMMFDAGLLVALGPLMIGGGVQNLGSFGSDKSPMNLRGGAAFKMGQELVVAGQVDMPSDTNKMKMSFGGEFVLAQLIALRGGYRMGGDVTGMTFGGGIQSKLGKNTYALDYAMEMGDPFAATHRFSIRAVFGQ